MSYETKSLAEVGVFVLDCEHKTPEAQREGFPYIAIPDIQGGRVILDRARRIKESDLNLWTRRTTPRAGDVLVTRRGRVGDTAPIPADVRCAIGQNLVLLRSDEQQVAQGYLRWAVRSPQWWAEVDRLMNVGAVFSSLNVRDIAKIRVPVPGLETQEGIAAVLGALDDKVAANMGLADTADAFTRAKFEALTLTETKLVPLFDAVNVDYGEPFKGTEFSEPGTGRPLIRIRDLKTFRPQIWTLESRPREVVVRPGDIVIGMDAEFRATAWLGEAGLLNQRVCRVSSDFFGAAYLREALRAPLAARENEKSATTVIHLNKSDLARTVIAVPAATQLAEFEAVAEPVFTHRIALAEESRNLTRLRDTLLPELMSGRLRVKDAEKKIEEVV